MFRISTKIHRCLWRVAFVTVLTGLLASCSDYFDRTDDGAGIGPAEFHGDAMYAAAITDVYCLLRAPELYGETLTLGLASAATGELTPHDEATRAAAAGEWQSPPLMTQREATLRAAYRAVAACNQIVASARAEQGVATTYHRVAMSQGEALGVRATVMLDLLRLCYPPCAEAAGPALLPYPAEAGTTDLPLLTREEIMTRVRADLAEAASLLRPVDPLLLPQNSSAVSVAEADRRLRTMAMNYYAVSAIEARAALWAGDYDQALAAADTVFRHVREVAERHQIYHYVAPGKYGSDFSFSREYVFALSSLPTGFAETSRRLFADEGVRVGQSLAAVYPQTADIRYRAWFSRTADGSYEMAMKFGPQTRLEGYLASTTGASATLPAAIPVIKLGEVALIAAEALTRLGRTAEALTWIDEMETSKGVTYAADLRAAGAPTQQQVLALIAEEYRRDLYGEGQWGLFRKRVRSFFE